jgi:spermidine synthase
MGTGITAGAALMHPVGSVVALEIVPEVAEAARQDFAEWNARVVDDRRVEVVVDDGRNYLASTPAAFDVIVGDLLVPWRPAEAPLYTREHFASVRAALTADGVFCQWLPLYQLSPDQLAIIARTFLDVFPSATLWRGNFDPGAATLALVGQRGAGPLEWRHRRPSPPPGGSPASGTPSSSTPRGCGSSWSVRCGPPCPGSPPLA